MGQMEDEVAIVTGGASGIGAACTTTLAREGARVAVTDLDDAGGQAVVDKIGSARRRGVLCPSRHQLRGELAGCYRTHRAALRAIIAMRRAGTGGKECAGILQATSGRAP